MTDSVARKRIQTAIRIVRPEVCRVLFEVWDPIGVREDPEAPRTEYDGYAEHVIGQLFSGATDDEIAGYLYRQATESMGITYQKESAYLTVAALRQISLPPLLL